MTRSGRLLSIAAMCLRSGSALVAQARGPAELAAAAVPPGAIRISYGADPLQFGELRVPAGPGPHPVAIVVHGGCWASTLGTLPPPAIALDNMRPLSAALTAEGIATWNIECRRLDNPGGGWPGTFHDLSRGADVLRTLAGKHSLDLSRVFSIGHSAGGHFALWLAARHKILAGSEIHSKDPLRLIGAINLDGPGDLRAMITDQQRICGRAVITELMGGSPEERPERYRAASPVELLPAGVQLESLTGRVFGAQNAAYEAAIAKAGDRSQALTIDGAGHFTFIDPQSAVWPQVLAVVRRVLGK
jgi:pimeloyl-ACP methyl ester carboxylesterase